MGGIMASATEQGGAKDAGPVRIRACRYRARAPRSHRAGNARQAPHAGRDRCRSRARDPQTCIRNTAAETACPIPRNRTEGDQTMTKSIEAEIRDILDDDAFVDSLPDMPAGKLLNALKA